MGWLSFLSIQKVPMNEIIVTIFELKQKKIFIYINSN